MCESFWRLLDENFERNYVTPTTTGRWFEEQLRLNSMSVQCVVKEMKRRNCKVEKSLVYEWQKGKTLIGVNYERHLTLVFLERHVSGGTPLSEFLEFPRKKPALGVFVSSIAEFMKMHLGHKQITSTEICLLMAMHRCESWICAVAELLIDAVITDNIRRAGSELVVFALNISKVADLRFCNEYSCEDLLDLRSKYGREFMQVLNCIHQGREP